MRRQELQEHIVNWGDLSKVSRVKGKGQGMVKAVKVLIEGKVSRLTLQLLPL